MALQITVQKNGVTYTDSYHKISRVSLDKDNGYTAISIEIKVYCSGSYSAQEPLNFLYSINCAVPINILGTYFDVDHSNTYAADAIIKSAYMYLKSEDYQGEDDYYNNAIDV